MVDAGVLVGTLELREPIDIDARLGRIGFIRGADNNPGAVDLLNNARTLCHYHSAGIARDNIFHASSDKRSVRLHQRHGLTLHVRAHQSTVGVIVFKERDQRRGNRDNLLWTDVHQVDLIFRQQRRFAVYPAGDQIINDLAVLQRDVGLGDDVLGLFHRRHVNHLFGDLAVLHPPVRTLDEAILVDHRVGGQRVDQTNVRPFGRFDRADPAVVGRVHVAHFETRPFTRQTARTKRRQAALVGDLRKRVGLVHELRQLRGAEELTHRSRRRLGVDQVMRHHGVDIDAGHPLLDRPFHPQQADAVLVLQQFTDRANPTIAKVVDVVDLTSAVAKPDQRLEDFKYVFLAEDSHVVRAIQFKADVHLHPTDRRQVIAILVEEQALEHRLGGLDRRRLTRTHHAIDIEQCILAKRVLIYAKGVSHVAADIHVVDVEDVDGGEAFFFQRRDIGYIQLIARFSVNLACAGVDLIARQIAAHQGLRRQQQRLQTVVRETFGLAS